MSKLKTDSLSKTKKLLSDVKERMNKSATTNGEADVEVSTINLVNFMVDNDKKEIDYTGICLIPSMLDTETPENLLSLSRVPQETEHQILSILKFDFIPNGFFSRLLLRTLALFFTENTDLLANEEPPYLWADGLLLHVRKFQLFYRKYPSLNKVEIQVRGSNSEIPALNAFFCAVFDMVNGLLGQWPNLYVQRSTACMSCVKENRFKWGMFTTEELEKRWLEQVTEFSCPECGANVKFSEIAPDLNMCYVTGQIAITDVELDEEPLGVGAFGAVYKGNFNGNAVAVKKITKNRGDKEFSVGFGEFRREAYVMSGLSCPYLVQLLAVCLDPLALVLELCTYGDLFDFLHKSKEQYEINWDAKLRIAQDIASGMLYLHSQVPPIIHLDLKSPNCLVNSINWSDQQVPCIKISDFGLASTAEQHYTKLVDNPIWLAPEIIAGIPYSYPSEYYAFGVILFETVTRQEFFGDQSFHSEISERIVEGIRPEIPTSCLLEMKSLVTTCWHQNPEARPNFSEILDVLADTKQHLSVYQLLAISSYLFDFSVELQEKITNTNTPINNTIRKASQSLSSFRTVMDLDPQAFLPPQILENLKKMLTIAVEEEFFDRGRSAENEPESTCKISVESKAYESTDRTELEAEKSSECQKLLTFLRLDLSRGIVANVRNSARSVLGTEVCGRLVLLLSIVTTGLVECIWILRQVLHHSKELSSFLEREERKKTSRQASAKTTGSIKSEKSDSVARNRAKSELVMPKIFSPKGPEESRPVSNSKQRKFTSNSLNFTKSKRRSDPDDSDSASTPHANRMMKRNSEKLINKPTQAGIGKKISDLIYGEMDKEHTSSREVIVEGGRRKITREASEGSTKKRTYLTRETSDSRKRDKISPDSKIHYNTLEFVEEEKEKRKSRSKFPGEKLARTSSETSKRDKKIKDSQTQVSSWLLLVNNQEALLWKKRIHGSLAESRVPEFKHGKDSKGSKPNPRRSLSNERFLSLLSNPTSGYPCVSPEPPFFGFHRAQIQKQISGDNHRNIQGNPHYYIGPQGRLF
eukprot:TRINITY_DN3570_c0_g1_i1.p1 TRINITY_DN3570_c0_g1~~TRINITY_DN3570_c0_g1_i1.p1  ORF type:complete len:1039 (-),score=182.15 TRINITY_DN3570_c0_g1_i1:186-3302(-)